MFDEDKIDFAPVPISIESRFIWSSDKLIEARLAPCFALVLPSTHTVKELQMINLFIRLKTREDIFSYIIWIIGSLDCIWRVFKFIGNECNVTKTSFRCVLHKNIQFFGNDLLSWFDWKILSFGWNLKKYSLRFSHCSNILKSGFLIDSRAATCKEIYLFL